MPSRVQLRDDYDGSGLRALAKRSRDPRQIRRLLALAAVYDSMSATHRPPLADAGLPEETMRNYDRPGPCSNPSASRQGARRSPRPPFSWRPREGRSPGRDQRRLCKRLQSRSIDVKVRSNLRRAIPKQPQRHETFTVRLAPDQGAVSQNVEDAVQRDESGFAANNSRRSKVASNKATIS